MFKKVLWKKVIMKLNNLIFKKIIEIMIHYIINNMIKKGKRLDTEEDLGVISYNNKQEDEIAL